MVSSGSCDAGESDETVFFLYCVRCSAEAGRRLRRGFITQSRRRPEAPTFRVPRAPSTRSQRQSITRSSQQRHCIPLAGEHRLDRPPCRSPQPPPQTIDPPLPPLEIPLTSRLPIRTTRTQSTHPVPKIAIAPAAPSQRQTKPTIRLYPQSPRRFASSPPLRSREIKLDPWNRPASRLINSRAFHSHDPVRNRP